jgi:hypothetical protein
MTEPRVFVVTLRPERGVDGVRALRAALKHLLRRHGLRCVAVRAAHQPPPWDPATAITKQRSDPPTRPPSEARQTRAEQPGQRRAAP